MGTLSPTLCKGDTIAFVSPSSRLNAVFPRRIDYAKAWLEKEGFLVKVIFDEIPKDATFQVGIQYRCEEIHKAFKDEAVKAIVCTIGGLSCNELLNHLDYKLIAVHPKIFVGYSDITILHHALFTQANLRTFYGPAAIPSLGEDPAPLPLTAKHFLHVLRDSGGRAPGPVPHSNEWTDDFVDWRSASGSASRTMQASPKWKWLRDGTASGRLTGGCLPSLLKLAGTKYWPDFRNCILFLETPEGDSAPGTPYPLEAARSCMADLVNLGVLNNISGLVIGRPYQYDDKMRADFERMMLDLCSTTDLHFPILGNVDLGHSDPMVTLPLWGRVSLDSFENEFNLSGLATLFREPPAEKKEEKDAKKK